MAKGLSNTQRTLRALRQYKKNLGIFGTLKALRQRRQHPSVKDRRRAKDLLALVRFKRRQQLKNEK